MKKNVKKLSDNRIEVKVTLEAPELKLAQEAAENDLIKQVKVKGFREGKVPKDVAKKNINQMELMNRTAELAINNALVIIINEEKIKPLLRPDVQLGNFTPSVTLEFTASFTVLPDIKIPNYKKLSTKKSPVEIRDEDIENVINNLLSGQAKKSAKKGKAELGDEVVIEFVGRFAKGDKEFPGGSGKDFPLKLGSNQFIPGFEDALVGTKAGQKLDIPLTFPKDYHVKDLAGQKVKFNTKVQKINSLEQPELTDDFAASLGAPNVKTVQDLRDDIERELTMRAEYNINERFRNDLLEELVSKTSFDVPKPLVDDQIGAMKADVAQNLTAKGQKLEDFLKQGKFKSESEWENKELRPIAEKRVKAGLVVTKLAELERIEVSKQEIDARIAAMQTQFTDQKLKDMYSTPEAHANIANQLAAEKTLARLAELNKG
jgi:trigger factor